MNNKNSILKKEKELSIFFSNKKFKIVCFGASHGLTNAIAFMKNIKLTPDYVCDNDIKKQNQVINNYKVYNPSKLFSKEEKFIVIISSMYTVEITKQLKSFKSVVLSKHYSEIVPRSLKITKLKSSYPQIEKESLEFFSKKGLIILEKKAKYTHKYMDFLSYCNDTILKDSTIKSIDLHETLYNFNENHYKNFLEYCIMNNFEKRYKKKIKINFLENLLKANLVGKTKKVLKNLSLEKIERVKNTQKLQKNNPNALIIHLYYIDMLEEIFLESKNYINLFDVYISISPDISLNEIEKIINYFPKANIFLFENRGRDMLPFINILKYIQSLKYNTICKIHTKKSLHRKDGEKWGKELRESLFNSSSKIISMLKDNKTAGFVAKENLLKNDLKGGINKKNTKELCKLLDIKFYDDFYFPAGAMFWIKASILTKLTNKKLQNKYFSLEDGSLDGKLEHAIERTIGILAKENNLIFKEVKTNR